MQKEILKKAILDFMNSNHLNQEQAAARLEVKPSSLSRWLSDKQEITKKHQVRIGLVCRDFIFPKTVDERNHPVIEIQQIIETIKNWEKIWLSRAVVAILELEEQRNAQKKQGPGGCHPGELQADRTA